MASAQKMMANMKADDMKRMTQMAANMDPKVMENMMKSMGGDVSRVDTAQAVEQMKNMSPEQLQAGMTQAQRQLGAQKQYYLNAAEVLKREGNAEVKNERYQEALSKYTRALDNLKSFSGDDLPPLQVVLLNNSALCYLKLKKYEKAVEACNDALKLQPSSFKSFFRRGQAQSELGNAVEAVSDVRKASELSPNDAAISVELQLLRDKLDELGLKEVKEEPRMPTEAPQAHSPPAFDSGMARQMEHIQKNPDLLKSAVDTFTSLPEEDRDKFLTRKDDARLNMFDNPDMINQAVEMTKNMSEEDMKKLNINSPEEADMMRKAAAQMAENPDLTKHMSEMMKNMPPEQLKDMMNLRRGTSSGGGGGLDPSSLMSNPDMMKATEDMMKNMSPDMLSSMARASGMAGDQNFSKDADSLQRVAKQMSENPDMAKQMTEMMKNVSPEQMQNMMKLTATMRGDGKGDDDEGGMDPSALLNDPDMIKVTEDLMKNMSPEMLASMARASGVDMSDDKAKLVAKFLPWIMTLIRWFGYIKRVLGFFFTKKGRIAVAVIVVSIALSQHYSS